MCALFRGSLFIKRKTIICVTVSIIVVCFIQAMSLKSGKFKVIGGRSVPDGIQLREPQVWKREGGGGGREGRGGSMCRVDTIYHDSRTDFDDVIC